MKTPVTFQYRKGRALPDSDLLRAWSHVSTERLTEMVASCAGDTGPVQQARQRVMALRRKAETGAA